MEAEGSEPAAARPAVEIPAEHVRVFILPQDKLGPILRPVELRGRRKRLETGTGAIGGIVEDGKTDTSAAARDTDVTSGRGAQENVAGGETLG